MFHHIITALAALFRPGRRIQSLATFEFPDAMVRRHHARLGPTKAPRDVVRCRRRRKVRMRMQRESRRQNRVA